MDDEEAYEEEEAKQGPLARFLRVARHPIRVFAMATAAICLVSGIATGTGMTAAILGAVGGVVLGEVLGRSRWRLRAILALAFALVVFSWAFSSVLLGSASLVRVFGTGGSLSLAAFLRYGSAALALTGGLRASALRLRPAIALELGLVVLALARVFAAHRQGIIARPLFLSDWAWRQGMDPADVLLGVGAGAAALMAGQLALERKGKKSLIALLMLPVAAFVAVSCLDVTGLPTYDPEDGQPPIDDREGEEPQDTPEQGDHGPGGHEGGDGGGRGGDAGAGDAGQERGGDAGADGGQGSGGDGGLDGGVGHGGDGGLDGGAGGGGLDGGLDGGGGGGGLDGGGGGGGGDTGRDGGGGRSGRDGGGGPRDGGGGGGGGGDAGRDGGSGGGGAQDAGGGGGSGQDGGAEQPQGQDGGSGQPPPDNSQQQQQQQDQQGQGGQVNTEPDLMDQPPPSDNGRAAPVAVIIFENDYTPPMEAYYFRQSAWSEWTGSRLMPATTEGVDADLVRRMPAQSVEVPPPPAAMRSELSARVATLVEHTEPFALEGLVSMEPIRNPNSQRFRQAYRFVSRPQRVAYAELLGQRADNPEWSEEVRQVYLTPHPDPRFTEFAEEVVATLPPERQDDPFARAVAIKLRLDQELTYSTRHTHANVPDPTVDFFFGNRIGYCVHFAHAAVFLWRAAGIPARVGVGYMAPEANRRGGSALLLNAGDAHAWPELYLEGIGWVVLDIAARENLDPPGQGQDEDLQRILGEMAREQEPEPDEELNQEQAEPPPDYAAGLRWAALLLLAAALLALYGIKLWRRLIPLFAPRSALPRVAYRAFLDRLSEAGLTREFGETRFAFARRVKEHAPSFEEMSALHESAALADPARPEPARPELDRARWRALLKEGRKELGSSVPLWRRLLGLIYPTSFLDSR